MSILVLVPFVGFPLSQACFCKNLPTAVVYKLISPKLHLDIKPELHFAICCFGCR